MGLQGGCDRFSLLVIDFPALVIDFKTLVIDFPALVIDFKTLVIDVSCASNTLGLPLDCFQARIHAFPAPMCSSIGFDVAEASASTTFLGGETTAAGIVRHCCATMLRLCTAFLPHLFS